MTDVQNIYISKQNQQQLTDVAQIEITSNTVEMINNYINLILQANQKHNLLGKSTINNFFIRHICDCAHLVPFLKNKQQVIDFGSGSGLPGLLMAIMLPGISFTLLEKSVVKAKFLSNTVAALGLKNVTVANCVLEDYIKKTTNNYDTCISRAFKPLDYIMQNTQKFNNIELLCMKGKSYEAEIAKAKKKFNFSSKVYFNATDDQGVILQCSYLK